MKNILLICLTVLILVACTIGDYDGMGGSLVINDLTDGGSLEGKFIAVEGIKDELSIGYKDGGRLQLKNNRLNAPLYNLVTKAKYAPSGNDNFTAPQFTIKVYENKTGGDPVKTINKAIAFRQYGSCVIEIKNSD